MLKMARFWRATLLGLTMALLMLSMDRLAQAQDPPDTGIRLEWRIETEPEYHHKYTNCVLVQGLRKLVFQPPAGWIVRLLPAGQKVICQPVVSGQWLSLQLVSTNALVPKIETAAITLDATNAPAVTNAPSPSNLSLIKPQALEAWYQTSLPLAKIIETREIHANGLAGMAATLQYTENGELRFCQAACVDLFTNFVVLTHAVLGTNNGSMVLNGVLTSLSLETNAPAR
jgi:hypothetical protein